MVLVYKIKDEALGAFLVKVEKEEDAVKLFPKIANMELIAVVADYVITAMYFLNTMLVKV